jgi:hypothetical protein
MEILYEISSASNVVHAPEPYALYAEAGLTAFEWIQGSTLESMLKFCSRSDTCLHVARAGGWLAELIRSSRFFYAPLDVDDMLSSAKGMQFPGIEKYMSLLHTVRHAVAREPTIWFPCFGDFKPANLILSRDRLYGIDSQIGEAGPAVIDAAHFLNHTALLQMWRLAGRDSLNWTALQDDAFRAGRVGNAGAELHDIHLLWARLLDAMRLADSYQGWSRPPASWIVRWSLNQLMEALRVRIEAVARHADLPGLSSTISLGLDSSRKGQRTP